MRKASVDRRTNDPASADARKRFLADLKRFESDPESLAERLVIEVNEEICRVMKAREISRAELARIMMVSRQFITRILNGNPNLTLLTLVRIAAALETLVCVRLVEGKRTFIIDDSMPSAEPIARIEAPLLPSSFVAQKLIDALGLDRKDLKYLSSVSSDEDVRRLVSEKLSWIDSTAATAPPAKRRGLQPPSLTRQMDIGTSPQSYSMIESTKKPHRYLQLREDAHPLIESTTKPFDPLRLPEDAHSLNDTELLREGRPTRAKLRVRKSASKHRLVDRKRSGAKKSSKSKNVISSKRKAYGK